MNTIDSQEFLEKSESIQIVDVRSPEEFRQGHIPGAINISLFSDEERSEIGKIYKKQGRDAAVRKGLEFVGPQMVKMVDEAKKIDKEGEILVHCWRGGMRSQSMAWLFETAGLKCHVLNGGYKAYRKHIRENLVNGREIIVLGGLTGSGKTIMLRQMKDLGEPVIDLEGLAEHKGSAFGGIGQKEQPSTEQFENDLYRELCRIKEPYIWVEDESLQIGKVFIPEPFFERMLRSNVLFIEVPDSYRTDILVSDYAGQDKALLEAAILKVTQRLGNLASQQAIKALWEEDYAETARILLTYYDKTYKFGLNRKNKEFVHHLDLRSISPEGYAKAIIARKKIMLEKIIPGIQ